MKKDVSVVFSTGRKTFHQVAAMLAKDITRYNHLDKYNLHLIVSYDPSFQKLTPKDFQVSPTTLESFQSVTYTGPEDYSNLKTKFSGTITDQATDILFSPRGYCTQKNRAIVKSLELGVEHIVFLDDDEYFVAPFPEESGLAWKDQDVLGVHLANQSNADITNGAHTGYFSPVPSEMDLCLEERLRERLGSILAIGSECITPNTFINTRNSVRYGSKEFVNAPPYEILEETGVKGLNGGNITLNVSSIRSGMIPPYFNPVGSRGEDAILGMQLKEAKVLRVPVYTFHDPFQKYKGITTGKYPQAIEAIQVIDGTIDRFCKACIGWVRYAPFLIRMTSPTEEAYEDRIKSMQNGIGQVGREIDTQLNWDGFHNMAPNLDRYHHRSAQDVEELYVARNGWKQLVQSL